MHSAALVRNPLCLFPQSMFFNRVRPGVSGFRLGAIGLHRADMKKIEELGHQRGLCHNANTSSRLPSKLSSAEGTV